jgi:CRP-like cAMP-binding protein
MPAAHRLKIVESRHNASYRPRGMSKSISSEVVERLAPLAITAHHPKGTVLFAENQPCRGVFILCSGRVNLFTASSNGKAFILRFADPGEMRETVTRVLSRFKKSGLIHWKGRNLLLANRVALESSAAI